MVNGYKNFYALFYFRYSMYASKKIMWEVNIFGSREESVVAVFTLAFLLFLAPTRGFDPVGLSLTPT